MLLCSEKGLVRRVAMAFAVSLMLASGCGQQREGSPESSKGDKRVQLERNTSPNPDAPGPKSAATQPQHSQHRVTLRDDSTWLVRHAWTPAGTAAAHVVEMTISKDELRRAIDGYGIARKEQEVSYRSEEELAAVLAEREERFLSRGIQQKYENGEVSLRPAHIEVSRKSLPQLRAVREALDRIVDQSEVTDDRARVDLYASFVQSFESDSPPRYRKNSSGEELLVCRARSPLETLYLGKGDCDSLSMLLAGLVESRAGIAWLFLSGQVGGDNHFLVGVAVAPQKGDLTVEYEERTYVLYELTVDSFAAGHTSNVKELLLGRKFNLHVP